MYVVVVFVLALLSPLPFASPFVLSFVLLSDHIVQDATFQSSIQHIFFGTPSFEITSNLTISPFDQRGSKPQKHALDLLV